ncbi:sensor histidine kinase [Evansella cellulosilytica]|uniref:histidine kinase n=1 Tax=Evansella cellulosilytica (strain ATCC 21833 / DSM 2522 / FERM P-1141 / JCM 9156 / N-4) TaxID=649639 RepID=E6TYX0_EVAC2|nr:HAMP domain-containing sensor histidine kinase [Evansella cellulosilytica]ADU31305.1 integral membrane sensor signal transduction histidine kinase [Evansella cellulosilytica DSM 2522]
MLPKNLSSRITAWVMLILLLSVIILIIGANWITKNFYQEHLTNEVTGRISSHAQLLEKDVGELVIEYIEQIETDKKSSFLILDKDLNITYLSEKVTDAKLHHFLSWINDNVGLVTADEPTVDRVDTSIRFHIPHVWALMPIVAGGEEEITGYVFLDQDTGDLNQAQLKLLYLLAIMGIITFVVGLVFTKYLTKRISKPLNQISETTKKIAEGNFDIELAISGEDEVSRLANSIQSMTKQLKQYRDSRRHFISHISHDLRTPITYIKGYSAVMKDTVKDDKDDWKQNLNVIYKEATRMENLVSDLFLLTKLEEGKIKLEKEKVPVASWLKSIYESRALMFNQKNIKHRLNIQDACKELIVFMDAYRLEQAIINIVENAIRHTPKEGEIELSLYKKSEQIIFSVRDTGSGINNKDLPHIWERFYKADTSRNRVINGGTGLGLAIVKEIVEAHGGKVKVASKVGEGTTFSIYLPLQVT